MSPHLQIKSLQFISAAGIAVSILCILGIANGMYTLGQLAQQTTHMSTTAVTAKADRALLYSEISLVSLIVSCIALFICSIRMKNISYEKKS